MDETGPGVTAQATQAEPEAVAAGTSDVSLAAAGDLRAFQRLYHEHVGRVHGLARRMLGPDEATEATQDAFVRAWEKLHTFRGEAAFGTWLYRLAINVFLARRGKAAQRRTRHVEDESVLERQPARQVHSELRLDFAAAIERLPEGARQIFVMFDIEGFRHDEIARALGISTGTSKAQLHRARMLMRRHLERE